MDAAEQSRHLDHAAAVRDRIELEEQDEIDSYTWRDRRRDQARDSERWTFPTAWPLLWFLLGLALVPVAALTVIRIIVENRVLP